MSNFGCKRGKEKTWVFDKSTGKRSNPNIKNIAAQFDFYDVRVENKKYSIEDVLSKLEDKVSPSLVKLIESKSCAALSDEERAWFATFCAVQFVRVENFRQQTKFINEALIEKVKALGGDPSKIEGLSSSTDEEEIKKFTIEFLVT